MRIFANLIGAAALFAAALVQAADVTIDFTDPNIPDLGPTDGSSAGFDTQGYRFSFGPEPIPAPPPYIVASDPGTLSVCPMCYADVALADGGAFSLYSLELDSVIGGTQIEVTGYRSDGSSELVLVSTDDQDLVTTNWHDLERVRIDAMFSDWIIVRNLSLGGGPEPVRFPSRVRSLGDINGDGVADIAVISPLGRTAVRGLDGRSVFDFRFTDRPGEITDIEVLADINGNGTPELALQKGNAGAGANEIRDSLTGELILYRAAWSGKPVDLELLPDLNGNGAVELINLLDEGPRLKLRDSLSGDQLAAKSLSKAYLPIDAAVYPDIDADGLPEIGVLSQNVPAGKASKLEMRNPLSGAQTARVRLSSLWNVLGQAPVGDLDNDGYPEVAILRTEIAGDRVHAVIISTAPAGGSVRQIPLDANFVPQQLLAIADVNGNGTREIVVFGVNAAGKQKAQIKDSQTGKLIRSLFFPPQLEFADVALSSDLNANGSQELLVLGKKADGSYRVTVKDAKTGALIDRVRF